MTRGRIARIVNTHGSRWGNIQPENESRQVFFNVASLHDPDFFDSLEVGLPVEFDERPDFVTGSHAEHVALAPAADPARL